MENLGTLMIKVLHLEIFVENPEELDQPTSDFSSCKRFCFNRFYKDSISFDEVRKLAKKYYYPRLNTRQISDCVMESQGLISSYKTWRENIKISISKLEKHIKKLEEKPNKTKGDLWWIKKKKKKLNYKK